MCHGARRMKHVQIAWRLFAVNHVSNSPFVGFTLPPGASSSSTQTDSQHQSQPQEPQVSLTAPVADDTEELPFVSQQQIMMSSMGTSLWMTLLALMMRAYAQVGVFLPGCAQSLCNTTAYSW